MIIKKLFHYFLVLTVILISVWLDTPVLAVGINNLLISSEEVNITVETSSIKKVNPGIFTFNSVWDYGKDKEASLDYVDCRDYTIGSLKMIHFTDNQILDSFALKDSVPFFMYSVSSPSPQFNLVSLVCDYE